MTKDKLFRKEYAQVLLALARGELEWAIVLTDHRGAGLVCGECHIGYSRADGAIEVNDDGRRCRGLR